MRIGFSTGSLALGDFRRGLRMATHRCVTAIELSALREQELDPLIDAIDSLEEELRPFHYISFHAPSRLETMSECRLVRQLQRIAKRGWAIIVHPDLITDFDLWASLGRSVCLENMDKRKKTARTAVEIAWFFSKLPEATFCFDIGHARQIDPTMQESALFLQCFKDRLRQVHMSYVNSQSLHEQLNWESVIAFRRVARQICESVPVILETPVSGDAIEKEVCTAKSIFSGRDNGSAIRKAIANMSGL